MPATMPERVSVVVAEAVEPDGTVIEVGLKLMVGR